MAAVAVHVFGTRITQGTRTQRAQAAAKNQNADGKLDQVLQASLHSQKAAVGGVNSGTYTFGLLYNATGDPMTYQTSHDWEGHVAGHYPIIIQNGQWAYCEMNEPEYFNYCDWTVIHNKLKDSGTTSEACMEGFTTKVTINADGNIRCFKAEFNLKLL
ncbi:hypothetical protein E3N88_08196 [Mikania micrantha]|uniref:Uncharacterized protein n=1 Tax=Mikania micrantha TaxID=192012 RepID=A0A5N6PHH3_9ASTR|nr:hypothetical protein E3N88_08196 [Mikania micrantha]